MATSNKNWFLQARLKTRQLLLLIALDDERNIHRAADALNITQPAASKQLKELEDLLGVSLFERQSRGMEPTIYGSTMIRHARMALSNLSNAHEDIEALKAGLQGQVNVGVVMTPAMTLLPEAIIKVKTHSPLLRISLQVANSNVLLEQLQRGAIDFMIGRLLEHQDKAMLDYEELASEPICAVVRVGHPLQKQKNLTLEQIAQHGWILSPPGTILRHKFDMMFRRLGIDPPVNVIEATEIPVINRLLQQSDFLHAFPVELARYYEELKLFAMLPIDLPCKMDAFGIITRQNYLLSPGATVLLDTIREVAAGIYPRDGLLIS